MISKISFGSTYKVTSNNNDFSKFSNFKSFIQEEHKSKGIYIETKDKMESKYPYNYVVDCTVVAPNYMDDKIERYCANNGINYIKKSPSMAPDALKLRVEEAPEGKIKTTVDVEKLEKLIQKQQSNISHCESDYKKYYHNDIYYMLKKGEKFPTTSLIISYQTGSCLADDAINYIKKFGADRLNDGQFFIGFTQRTQKPEHCVYFALRNSGMKEVPVYVDADTHKMGVALGILKP